jgi:glyoxylase-like metal-dependent hydrolase (beta-lactamase superfamily II)
MPEIFRRFEIGQFKCTAIADTDQDARNVLMVEGEQRILIDTGAGSHDPGNPGRLRERLEQEGLEAASIDAVVLSHADFDHIGGAVEGNQPAFPRAEYSITRTELDFWTQRPNRLVTSPLYDDAFRARVNSVPPLAIDVLADKLHLVDDPIFEVADGLTMIAAPGHTPGNSVVRIESQGDVLLFVADLFYQPENLATADWVSQYDYDPRLVVETRRQLLDEAATNHSLLMAYHMPFPGLGRVRRSGSAWEWTPA